MEACRVVQRASRRESIGLRRRRSRLRWPPLRPHSPLPVLLRSVAPDWPLDASSGPPGRAGGSLLCRALPLSSSGGRADPLLYALGTIIAQGGPETAQAGSVIAGFGRQYAQAACP